MSTLSGSTKKYLRSLAHHLKPVVMVGKNGVTDDLIRAVDEALTGSELIKIKFIEFKNEKKLLASEIAERTNSHVIGMIGNIAMLYRQHPDEDKREIKLS